MTAIQIRYNLWKSEPATNQFATETIVGKIEEVVIGLNKHYGLVPSDKESMESIFDYIILFLSKHRNFKLIDIDRSLEIFKKQPELNKITAAYFEECFNKYLKSYERIEMRKLYELENLPETKQIEKPILSPLDKLKENYHTWTRDGVIYLNSGEVYKENAALILDTLTPERMYEIIIEVKAKLIKDAKNKLELSMSRNAMAEYQIVLQEVEGEKALFVVAFRKAQLLELFQGVKEGKFKIFE